MWRFVKVNRASRLCADVPGKLVWNSEAEPAEFKWLVLMINILVKAKRSLAIRTMAELVEK